jgi:hypothetical protein
MGHGNGHLRGIHSRCSDRRFEKHSIIIDTKPIACRKLFCATPGCGQQGEVLDTSASTLPSAVVERKFKQKGWEVGRDPSKDFCPSCVATRLAARRGTRLKPIQNVVREDTTMPLANGADTLPEMSRSDRRIIFAKLEEVYQDEEHGYTVGWTDQTVARDLGSHIPVGWVAQVREENFGPAKDNEEVRDMLARVEKSTIEAKAILAEAKKVRAEASAMVERVNGLSKQCTEIGRALEGLMAIAERIRRAVS